MQFLTRWISYWQWQRFISGSGSGEELSESLEEKVPGQEKFQAYLKNSAYDYW